MQKINKLKTGLNHIKIILISMLSLNVFIALFLTVASQMSQTIQVLYLFLMVVNTVVIGYITYTNFLVQKEVNKLNLSNKINLYLISSVLIIGLLVAIITNYYIFKNLYLPEEIKLSKLPPLFSATQRQNVEFYLQFSITFPIIVLIGFIGVVFFKFQKIIYLVQDLNDEDLPQMILRPIKKEQDLATKLNEHIKSNQKIKETIEIKTIKPQKNKVKKPQVKLNFTNMASLQNETKVIKPQKNKVKKPQVKLNFKN